MTRYRTLLLLLLPLSAFGQQNLVFRGTVRCYNAEDPASTRGAKNVIVVPGFNPTKTAVSTDQGFYEVNTGTPIEKLDGKYVTVYYLSYCKECEVKKNVFVSDDQVRYGNNGRFAYLPVDTKVLTTACKKAEIRSVQSDSLMNVLLQQPAQDLSKASALNVITPTPGFLNLLTTIASTTAVAGVDRADADTFTVLRGRIGYGQSLAASPMRLSANTGFNFSPHRNLAEAVFWNPSGLAFSYNTGGVFGFTNIRNNHKASAYAKLTEAFGIGAGWLYTKQEEFRSTRFVSAAVPNNPLIPRHRRRLKEYAAYLSPFLRVNERLSVGAAIKSVWQEFNRPDKIIVTGTSNDPVNDFEDKEESKSVIDGDVSATYRLLPALTLGLNVMNIGGSKLSADALPAKRIRDSLRNLRSVGVGATYKWKQFHVGTDVLLAKGGLYDATIGVNYVPFNNALLSGGYALKQKSFSFAFRFKYFQISYVDDKDFLVDDGRKGKSGFLNGQLHSGFAVTF